MQGPAGVKLDDLCPGTAKSLGPGTALPGQINYAQDWTRTMATFLAAIRMEKDHDWSVAAADPLRWSAFIHFQLVMVVNVQESGLAILRNSWGAGPFRSSGQPSWVSSWCRAQSIGVIGTLGRWASWRAGCVERVAMVAGLEIAVWVQFLSSDVYFISLICHRRLNAWRLV